MNRSPQAVIPEGAESSYRKTATELRRRVWDPIVAHLGDAKRVLVVPDDALNLVTFAALPIGEDRYFVEEDRFNPLLVGGARFAHAGQVQFARRAALTEQSRL